MYSARTSSHQKQTNALYLKSIQRKSSRTSRIESGGFCRGIEVDCRATATRNDYISQNQSIHFRSEETIQCFLWLADHGLVLIKGRVEYHRYARQIAKDFNQSVISRIG
jgi:hypothetical protein